MRKLKTGNMNKENSTFEDLKVGQHGSATMYGVAVGKIIMKLERKMGT